MIMNLFFCKYMTLVTSVSTYLLSGILLKLKTVQDSIDRAAETDIRLMKNIAVTRRIGFADVILPGLHISLLYFYLLLISGHITMSSI